MRKRIFGFLSLLLLCVMAATAQQMPLNPDVRHGKLPNGLNYYILHNEEPKGRANFYIAQKVGSTLEKPTQLGLAHFLEHMCFNGIKTFPHETMLKYLQSKGLRFGEDINAYTAFDETVYNIDAVPTADAQLVDSVLMILHDWSCDLQLDDKEIDQERGVIESEWRQGNDASQRYIEAVLPQIYQEYQYHQSPIGSMDVVRNFKHDELRDYYHTWYRPDQQGIVIVGDVDVDALEKQIINVFSPIQMPAGVPERVYPNVSDNEGMIYVTFEDPEFPYPDMTLLFKKDVIPADKRNTMEYYMKEEVLFPLLCQMLNARLTEYSLKPDCKYGKAEVDYGQFVVSKTKNAFTLSVTPKKDFKAAFEQAYDEVVRACRTGFSSTELDRAKDEMLATAEQLYNERNKTNNGTLASAIIRHFIDNVPEPGITAEYMLLKSFLPRMTVEEINKEAASLITPNNRVMVVAQPKTAKSKPLPSKEEILKIMTGTENKQFEAYVDNVLSEPLIAKMPKPGSIKSQKEIPAFGATEFVLSNGVKVYLKTTDFADDKILFSAIAPIGLLAYPEKDASNMRMLPIALAASNLGKFDPNQLEKATAGKKTSLEVEIDKYTSGFSGEAAPKDLETMMQLLYLNFTSLNPNKEIYSSITAMMGTMIANQEKNADYVFIDDLYKGLYNNAHFEQMKSADISQASYDRMLEIAKQNYSNAANYDFIFVGNITAEKLRPMLEQYIATLPANTSKLSSLKNIPVHQVSGTVESAHDFPMESASVKEAVCIHGDNVPYNLQNSVKISLIGDILTIIYTRSLREELSGTYSPGAFGGINRQTGEWNIMYVYYTDADKAALLAARADSDLKELFRDGARPEDFAKAKGAAVTQADLRLKKNGFWLSRLQDYALYGYDGTQIKQATEALTLEELNAFMKTLWDGQNHFRCTLNAFVEEK